MSEPTPSVDEAPTPETPAIDAPAPAPPPLPAITSAKEWRRYTRGRWLITLPSAAVVKARRPDWARLISQNVLSAEELMAAQGVRSVGEIAPLARKLLPHIVVEPRIVSGAAADDEAISVDDISDLDALSLFGWANGHTVLSAVFVE